MIRLNVMMRRIAVALAACAGVAACVSSYKQAADTAPHATIEFVKGYTSGLGFGTSTGQQYYVLQGETCEGRQRAAFFTWMFGGDSKVQRIAANQPIHLSAVTAFGHVSGVGNSGAGVYAVTDSDYCYARAQFTPQEGHTYDVVQAEQSPAVCELQVTDTNTGEAPPDLVLNNNTGCPYSTLTP